MKKEAIIKKTTAKQQPVVVVNDITQVAPNRNRKDVGMLKAAIERAESVQVPNRVQLYDLYHDVTTIDGHLSGILQKRTAAVTNKSIMFVDKNKKRVEALDGLIESERFGDLLQLIMESRYWGVSGVEFLVGGTFDFEVIPRKHIRPERSEVVRSQYDFRGTPVKDLPFVWTVGKKKDLGILLKCSMYALYKRSGFGDFAQYVEIFGQPVRIIYYDAYDSRTKDELRNILNTSGSSLAMMVPKQAQFQMLDGKTSNGTGELQERLIKACNAEMSIAVLGNTETTASSSSSGYAQSKEHGKQQLEITKDDIKYVLHSLNSDKFKEVLRSYGYPVEGGHFEFEQEIDLSTLTQRINIDLQVASKVPVSDDYWYDTYGIPKPDNYDELKAEQQAQREAMQTALKQAGEKGKEDTDDNNPNKKDDKKQDKGKLFAALADFFGVAPQ